MRAKVIIASVFVTACGAKVVNNRGPHQGQLDSDIDASASHIGESFQLAPPAVDDPYMIKGLHHIFYAMGVVDAKGSPISYNGSISPDVLGNKVGRVLINVPWSDSEQKDDPTCAQGTRYNKIGCYNVSSNVSDAIENYAKAGIKITGLVGATPEWARDPGCNNGSGGQVNCAPLDSKADRFGNYAGYVASRFKGKIDTWIVYNEVNAKQWFNTCTHSKNSQNKDVETCPSEDEHVRRYAKVYSAAYDAIKAVDKSANVLISHDNHFTSVIDIQGASEFLPIFDSKVGNREWKLAFHPYSHDFFHPGISADDAQYGVISTGNLGVLEGFLIKQFPNKPHAHEIFLTESGFSRNSDADQASELCNSFRVVLGTPHVRQYLYYSWEDNPFEAAPLGLVTRKPTNPPTFTYHDSWGVFALANRPEIGRVSCGFENLGNDVNTSKIALTRGYSDSRGHSITSKILSPGFKKETNWLAYRYSQPHSHPVYECVLNPSGDWTKGHHFASLDVNCEGQAHFGLLGYLSDTKSSPDMVALRRCALPPNRNDHIILGDLPCSAIGWISEGDMGYAFPGK